MVELENAFKHKAQMVFDYELNSIRDQCFVEKVYQVLQIRSGKILYAHTQDFPDKVPQVYCQGGLVSNYKASVKGVIITYFRGLIIFYHFHYSRQVVVSIRLYNNEVKNCLA